MQFFKKQDIDDLLQNEINKRTKKNTLKKYSIDKGTPDQLMQMIKKDSFIFEHIDPKLQTGELCLLAVNQFGGNVKFINWNVVDEKIIEQIITLNKNLIYQIPKEFLNDRLYLIVSEYHGFGFPFSNLNSIKEEHLFRSIRYNAENFKTIRREKQTAELYYEAIKKWPYAIKYAPSAFQTYETCVDIIKQDGTLIYFVREDLIDQEMCNIAVERNGFAIEYVPRNFINENLIFKAIKEDANSVLYVWSIIENYDEETHKKMYLASLKGFCNYTCAKKIIAKMENDCDFLLKAIFNNKKFIKILNKKQLQKIQNYVKRTDKSYFNSDYVE